jgi:hypothetical protein
MDAYVTVGIDVGQKVDPTAIVVAEATRPAAHGETRYTARTIQRLPLGTSYPEVGRTLASLVLALHARGIEKPRLMLDATGCGLPVCDTLREALVGIPHVLVACMFTYGTK